MGNVSRDDFFAHWDQLPLVIEDYPYAGMDYMGDPELPRPPGQAWGPEGKRFCAFLCLHTSIDGSQFIWFDAYDTCDPDTILVHMCADVAPMRPT